MATILAERLAQLGQITLDKGTHSSFEEGHCGMEVVSYLAGESFTDAPSCASPVLRAFTIGLNDQWNHGQRQKLLPFLPRMVDTAGDGQDEARCYLALDWLIRSFTPAWLDLAGLSAEAQSQRNLRRIVDYVSAQKAGPVVQAARSAAAAARAAAWNAARAAARAAVWAAARDAAWDAARNAAGDAAGAAARAATGDAVWAAARAATGDAVWAAARDAAWDAARDAAWDAAGAAARAATGDAAGAAARAATGDAARAAAWAAAGAAAWAAAGAAAWAAAGAALRPTVETLQGSALELLDRMIDPSQAAA